MQGVQVVAARNDENSTQHGAAVQQLKASSSAPMQAAKQGSVLKSARKAFGNITNNAAAAGRGEASAGKPSVLKQPAAQQQPRRALGDITNSAAKPQAGGLGAGTAFKMQQDSKLGGAPAAAQAAPASAASSAAVSSRWAGDLQPERPAGKTWEQLEAERWADMEAEAAASADAILASLRRLAVPRPMPLAADSDDDDEDWTAAATSSWQRRPQHEQPPSSQDDAAELDALLDSCEGADLASLLPDIPLPQALGEAGAAQQDGAAAADTPLPSTPAPCTDNGAAAGAVCPSTAACGNAADPVRSPDPLPW